MDDLLAFGVSLLPALPVLLSGSPLCSVAVFAIVFALVRIVMWIYWIEMMRMMTALSFRP